ncbi:MAG: Flagellar hook-basal body complex protein FliE [Legionella sp.]|uniref:flagellar hook-basal body complex protein FliE n=1 Tax=Legionella sp. TaxID=459 RepID=UPI003D132DE9
MNDINTVGLFDQMQSMAAKAEGAIVDREANQSSFSAIFKNALNQVSDLSNNADSLKSRFELGDPKVSIGEVMIATQKSNLGLEAALRVRNKFLQAYQDIMGMPV